MLRDDGLVTVTLGKALATRPPNRPQPSPQASGIPFTGRSLKPLPTVLAGSWGRWLEDGWRRSEEGRRDSWLLSPVGNLYTRS